MDKIKNNLLEKNQFTNEFNLHFPVSIDDNIDLTSRCDNFEQRISALESQFHDFKLNYLWGDAAKINIEYSINEASSII